MKNVIVLYNDVGSNPAPDDLDTVEQAEIVAEVLGARMLGFKRLSDLNALNGGDIVFNLAEEFNGDCYQAYKIPLFLEKRKIPFTGSGSAAMKITGDKVFAKKLMPGCNIPTAPFVTLSYNYGFYKGAYIVKPARLCGSKGIEKDAIVKADSLNALRSVLKQKDPSKKFFAERYIDGREISVSVLEGKNREPKVLPPREMHFLGYGDGYKILDYAAKWDTESASYKNTVSEIMEDGGGVLIKKLKMIAETAWKKFRLRGYARIDFRIDKNGNPFVLEINVNPCINPSNSGFVLAAESAGLSFKDVVKILTKYARYE